MTPEILSVLNQAPLVAFIVIAVYLFNKIIRERDKEWKEFIDKQNRECREWSDKSNAALQAWQLEMANTIGAIADKVDRVDTKLDLFMRFQIGTGPLKDDIEKGRRGL